jgi:hypothetical protein
VYCVAPQITFFLLNFVQPTTQNLKVTIMSKRRSSDKSATSGKKQRKSITLEEKLHVIKWYEHNKCKVDITNAMGMPESNLSTIRKQAEKIKESNKSATTMTACEITQISKPIMVKLERMLAQWTEKQHQLSIPPSSMIKQLTEFFKHTDTAIGIIDDNDANRERSAKITRATENAMACYKKLYSKRQKAACKLSLHHFFMRAESCQSTGSAREPVQSDCAPHSSAFSESYD